MLGRRTPPPTNLVIALKDLPPPPAHHGQEVLYCGEWTIEGL